MTVLTPKRASTAAAAAAETSSPADSPSALDTIRASISERVADAEEVVGRLEARLADAGQQRIQLREHLEDAEVIRQHVLNNLARFSAREVEDAHGSVVDLRVQLATIEERFREAGSRISELRERQDVLRAILRSLGDLGGLVDGAQAAEGAARFRSASRQVFQIIEEERMRIARDMHDGPAQSMANLVLQAEVLERLIARDPRLVVSELADFKACVRDALEETRRLIFDLRPMTLDDLGLVPTLRKFVKEYGEKGGVATTFHLVGEERRLPGNYENVLFRIIQEALANVRKHAHAHSVEVTVNQQPHRVVAVVKDDGEGFDVAATEARLGKTRNLGLISMRERADLEKGDLEIRSQVGKGTEVRITFDY